MLTIYNLCLELRNIKSSQLKGDRVVKLTHIMFEASSVQNNSMETGSNIIVGRNLNSMNVGPELYFTL